MYEGTIRGGPLDGRVIAARRPGLLVVDRSGNWAYVYDWSDGQFVIRPGYERGQALDLDRRIATAESDGYDVIAWPGDD